MFNTRCRVCDTEFPLSKRTHAKTCSPRCRKTLSRWGERIDQLLAAQRRDAEQETVTPGVTLPRSRKCDST